VKFSLVVWFYVTVNSVWGVLVFVWILARRISWNPPPILWPVNFAFVTVHWQLATFGDAKAFFSLRVRDKLSCIVEQVVILFLPRAVVAVQLFCAFRIANCISNHFIVLCMASLKRGNRVDSSEFWCSIPDYFVVRLFAFVELFQLFSRGSEVNAPRN
jgi:hypothetical protein